MSPLCYSINFAKCESYAISTCYIIVVPPYFYVLGEDYILDHTLNRSPPYFNNQVHNSSRLRRCAIHSSLLLVREQKGKSLLNQKTTV